MSSCLLTTRQHVLRNVYRFQDGSENDATEGCWEKFHLSALEQATKCGCADSWLETSSYLSWTRFRMAENSEYLTWFNNISMSCQPFSRSPSYPFPSFFTPFLFPLWWCFNFSLSPTTVESAQRSEYCHPRHHILTAWLYILLSTKSAQPQEDDKGKRLFVVGNTQLLRCGPTNRKMKETKTGKTRMPHLKGDSKGEAPTYLTLFLQIGTRNLESKGYCFRLKQRCFVFE